MSIPAPAADADEPSAESAPGKATQNVAAVPNGAGGGGAPAVASWDLLAVHAVAASALGKVKLERFQRLALVQHFESIISTEEAQKIYQETVTKLDVYGNAWRIKSIVREAAAKRLVKNYMGRVPPHLGCLIQILKMKEAQVKMTSRSANNCYVAGKKIQHFILERAFLINMF